MSNPLFVKAANDLGGGHAAAVQMEKENAPSFNPPLPAVRSEFSASPILSASPFLKMVHEPSLTIFYKIMSLQGR
jgi:hypothetical protein